MSIQDFDNVTTGAAILNMDCTRVLLIQRKSNEIYPSQIALPGGRIRKGEDIRTAARREVREEVGLEVESLGLLGVYFAGDVMMVAFATAIEECPLVEAERSSFWIDVEQTHRLNLAPNVQDVIKHAVQHVKTVRRGSLLSQLGKAIAKGNRYLLEHTCTREGYIGWDHFLGRGRIGIVGTALGVLALCRSGLRSRCIDEGVTFLIDSVLPDGGWGLRSIKDAGEEISLTESTLYVMAALLSAGVETADKVISNGVNWLGELQHPDGGWGTAKFRSASYPRVFPTAFAISVLSRAGYDRPRLKDAVDWLRAAQKPDGSWGALAVRDSPKEQGAAAYAARSVVALLDHDEVNNRSAVDRGIRWLVNSYDPRHEQGWSSSSEVTFVSDRSRIDFKHFATPWVLSAFIRSGVKLSEPLVIQPLIALLNEQAQEGYWLHHLAAGQIPIWATHDSLMALGDYKNSLWKEAGDLVLYRLLEEKQTQLLSLFISREVARSRS